MTFALAVQDSSTRTVTDVRHKIWKYSDYNKRVLKVTCKL